MRKVVRILVDALPARHGGGAEYVRAQLNALAALDPSDELHTLLSPWSGIAGLPGTVETVPVRSVATRYGYEVARLPFRRADVLYCPLNFGPVAGGSPMILTLHNPNYYGRGLTTNEVAGSRPTWKLKANRWAMRRADAIVAISESLAAEVAETFPDIKSKMHVIRSGAPVWPDQSTPVPGLPSRYVLSVASAAPHKRVDDVVSGWAQAADAMPPGSLSLVLVGGHTDDQISRHRSIAGTRAEQLKHLGRVSQRSQLKWIYENAAAMVSMSLLEAFPLTPAEAGSLGCPLVLSDIAAHREVTQGNATFVPTRDVEALRDALLSTVGNDQSSRRHWTWPITWTDNVVELRKLMQSVAS